MPTSSVRLAARILSFVALATALPAFAQDTSLLRYGGADRSRRLIAAAQKEGSFALYTSFAEKDLPPLTDLVAPGMRVVGLNRRGRGKTLLSDKGGNPFTLLDQPAS